MTTSPPSLPYFCSCYRKLLASPWAFDNRILDWEGSEGISVLWLQFLPQAQPFPKLLLARSSLLPWQRCHRAVPPKGRRRACNPQFWKDGMFIWSRLQMQRELRPFSREPASQSLKLTGPARQILLACILQGSRGSSSFAPLCKRSQLQLPQTWDVGMWA